MSLLHYNTFTNAETPHFTCCAMSAEDISYDTFQKWMLVILSKLPIVDKIYYYRHPL